MVVHVRGDHIYINSSHLEQKHTIKILTHAVFGLPYGNILPKFNLNRPETCFAVIVVQTDGGHKTGPDFTS